MPRSTSGSFLEDDSPPESPAEEQRSYFDTNGGRSDAAPGPSSYAIKTPVAVGSNRHDSPFDTPTRKARRSADIPIEQQFSPQRRRPGSRLSLRSAHNEDYDAPLVPVLVHLRTNVVVKDESKLVIALSSALSSLYTCSKDAIMVNVDHSVCLMLGTSFDPAYFLHIQTLPTYVDPDLNALATADLQPLIARTLQVPPHRGILRFQPISADFVSTSGTTFSRLGTDAVPNPALARAHSVQPPPSRGLERHNPTLPPGDAAADILQGQIASMSEAGSVRGPSPAPLPSRRAYSPSKDWHGAASARRYASENLDDATDETTSDASDGESESSGAEPPPAIQHKAVVAGQGKRRSLFGLLGR